MENEPQTVTSRRHEQLPLGPLGHRQAMILSYLWGHGPTSATDLHAALSRRDELAYTTIHTELSRLLQKGLVTKSGRSLETKYDVALSRQQYLERRMSDTLNELVQAHGAAAIHGFVDLVAQDEAMMAELRTALKRRRR
ncbi:hypothetical protein EPN52_07600 [bacterium]|nr:MAG: hypothetical protein EPN52_07600 [bacterium]